MDIHAVRKLRDYLLEASKLLLNAATEADSWTELDSTPLSYHKLKAMEQDTRLAYFEANKTVKRIETGNKV
jgi:hypothetical protein